MSSEFDQRNLLSMFVAEASECLKALREALHSNGENLPARSKIRDRWIRASCIKGAAAACHCAGIACLCERLETLCQAAETVEDTQWPRTVEVLRELVSGVFALVQAIRKGEGEDWAIVERCLALSDGLVPHTQNPLVSMPLLPAVAQVSPAAINDQETPSSKAPAAASPSVEFLPSREDSYFVPRLDPEAVSYFIPEAEGYLEALEGYLLKIGENPHDRGLIAQLFRTAHTLKGSAYTVGFHAIGDLIHQVEDFMGAVRDGRTAMKPEHAEVMLQAIDLVHFLLRRDPSTIANTRQRFQTLLSELKRIDQGRSTGATATVLEDRSEVRQPERQSCCEGESGRADSQANGSSREERHMIRVSYARLEQLMNLAGELVIGRGRLEQRLKMVERMADQVLACQTRMIHAVQSLADRPMFPIQAAPAEHQAKPVSQGVYRFAEWGSLKLCRYDDFNILAGHIGEAGADIAEAIAQLRGAVREAQEEIHALQQQTGSLRDEIERARMVPVGVAFSRFRRAVREAARLLDKQVVLVTSGEHTEVDARLVEGLVDPLVHLIRNAVYHGIESPAERAAKGKPALGTIHLRARQCGQSIAIEVEDDGAGLNSEKILTKAVAMGLVRRDQIRTVSSADMCRLIFSPGFSTVGEVDQYAGRGVGLDVVKRTVEGLYGRIEVESEPEIGTKFILIFPLVPPIATAWVVRVGEERYAIGLPHILDVTCPPAGSLMRSNDRTLLLKGGEAIEVRSLPGILYQAPSPVEEVMPIVIVRAAKGPVGLAVDELLGQQEIVMKPLSSLKFLNHFAFVGATIDPEGRLVFVIDPSRFDQHRPLPMPAEGEPPAGIIPTGGQPVKLREKQSGLSS